MTQPNLFDRVAHLRRLIAEYEVANAARLSYLQSMQESDARTASNLLPALAEALEREIAAEQALPGESETPTVPQEASAEADPLAGSACGAANPPTEPPSATTSAAPNTTTPTEEGEQSNPFDGAASGVIASVAGNSTASPTASPAEYDGPPPSWWVGEDLADLGLRGADVLAACCASQLLGAKPGKPATVTPLGLDGSLYVSTIESSQWHWYKARLRVLVPRDRWVVGEPHAEERPDGRYRGRLVRVKRRGEYVIGAGERVVRWTDANAQRPPAGWKRPEPPVFVEEVEPPETPQAVGDGLLFAPETPTAQGEGL